MVLLAKIDFGLRLVYPLSEACETAISGDTIPGRSDSSGCCGMRPSLTVNTDARRRGFARAVVAGYLTR
jgi:hypothetical protein